MRVFYNDIPYEVRVIYSYDNSRIRKIIFYGLNFLDPDPKYPRYDCFTLFEEYDISSVPRAVSILSEVGELELVQRLLRQYSEIHHSSEFIL